MDIVLTALQSGIASLASYLAAHVLLCLVPAFFIAGALSALVPQQSIVRFLGPAAPKWVAYPAAAGAGSLLAVCSCTVQPLFAGIYSKGAGLGPAITFMFFAPAANILALSYTGVALGADFAIARLVLSLVFGIGIGMIMALIFHRSDTVRLDNAAAFEGGEGISRQTLIFLGTLIVLLVGGTLKLDFLTTPLLSVELPWAAAVAIQNALNVLVPIDLIKGDEGLSVQGVILIGMLGLIALTAWRGLGKVDDGFTRLTFVSLGLIAATLIFAALGIVTNDTGLVVTLSGRTLVVAAMLASLWPLSRRFEAWDIQQWLWETWRFVKMIFPLLIVGVFPVGVIRMFIRPMGAGYCRQQLGLGQHRRRRVWCFHVFPDARRSTYRQDVSLAGHAPRPTDRLFDGRSGTFLAKHPHYVGDHRQAQGLDLRRLGCRLFYPGRADLWGMDRWHIDQHRRPRIRGVHRGLVWCLALHG